MISTPDAQVALLKSHANAFHKISASAILKA